MRTPPAAGIEEAALGGLKSSTHGYGALWPACSLRVLGSAPSVRRLYPQPTARLRGAPTR
jgi:hypothetical protein